MQKWEYTTLVRTRGWSERKSGENWHWFAPWNISADEIEKKLSDLGEAGWELVSVVAESGVLGGYDIWVISAANATIDYAGFTTTEKWVFKRPKS